MDGPRDLGVGAGDLGAGARSGNLQRRYHGLPSAPTRFRWKRGAQTQAIGRSAGGPTTKIHALVDGLGNPVKLELSPGNESDVEHAPKLLENVRDAQILLDKGYDSDPLRERLRQQGCTPLIPPRKNRRAPRPYDKHTYKDRHLVENFFEKIKRFRRVATRYDKLAVNFMGFVTLASILVWLA